MGLYVGGPCDGQTFTAYLGATTQCGGVYYSYAEDGNYHALGGTYPGGPLAGEGQVWMAWSGLMRELAVKAPHSLARARAAGKRMRSVVR